MNLSIMAGPGRTPAQPKAAAPATEAAARAGLAAQGVIYLLVGLLALQVAFGRREAQADQQGALATLSDQPFGAVLLWALGIGLVGMALWRLSEAVFGGAGPDGRKPHMRLLALGPSEAGRESQRSPPGRRQPICDVAPRRLPSP